MLTTHHLPLALTAAITASPTPATITAYASLALVLVPLLVVAAAAIVLVRHGLRGTDPGPAGRMLLTLVRIVLRRPPRA